MKSTIYSLSDILSFCHLSVCEARHKWDVEDYFMSLGWLIFPSWETTNQIYHIIIVKLWSPWLLLITCQFYFRLLCQPCLMWPPVKRDPLLNDCTAPICIFAFNITCIDRLPVYSDHVFMKPRVGTLHRFDCIS